MSSGAGLRKQMQARIQKAKSSADVGGNMENMMAMQTLARQNKQNSPIKSGMDRTKTRKNVINVNKFKNQNLRPMLINSKIPAEFRDDKTEFESILKNEQSDMKGNMKVEAGQQGLFPMIGPVNNVYTFILLVFQIITAFVLTFRMAFLPEIEYLPYVILDFITDFIFFCDMIIKFNLPVFEDCELITSRSRIAKRYLKFWFWIDLYCLFPFSYFRLRSMTRERNPDDFQNLLELNFKSLPRFYPMIVIFRMSRMRGLETNLYKMLKQSPLQSTVQSIIVDLFWMLFVMHICGCFLQAGAYFNRSTTASWVKSTGLEDADAFHGFIGAVYWSTVTTTTVGYGDITQTNPFELLFVFFIMMFGVAFLVTYLGDLSTLFSEMTQSSKAQQDRINQIHDLDQKFNIGPELVEKLTNYFEQNVAALDSGAAEDISYLLEILPASIKIQLSIFLNDNAIQVIDFLKDRPDSFYLNYLEKFRPMRFDKGDVIFEKGKKPREIYVNFGGKMLNATTNRVYPEGSLIGQDDILFNRDRLHSYVAKTELFTLKLERDVFDKMMKEFPEIKTELLEEANIRASYAKHQKDTRAAISNKEAKFVIRKFNQVSMQQNYENTLLQKDAATRKRDALFRRSNEFIFKDKRLRAAQPQQDGDGTVRRFASKNPKLSKIKSKAEKERRKKLGIEADNSTEKFGDPQDLHGQHPTLMGKLLVQAKRKMFMEENTNDGKKSPKLVYNEEGMKALTGNKTEVSPERRKTVHMAMHSIVQARVQDMQKLTLPGLAGRSTSFDPASRNMLNSNSHRNSSNDLVGDNNRELYQKFEETLNEQFGLVNFHKSQFEATMNSSMDADNLPDHMRMVLNKGLSGINNYLKLLESIRTLTQKENLGDKFRSTEKRMTDCVATITKAEEKLDQVMLRFGVQTERVPIKDKSPRMRADKKSMSVPPQNRNYDENPAPKQRYEEEKKQSSRRAHEPQQEQRRPDPRQSREMETDPDVRGRQPQRSNVIYKEKSFVEEKKSGVPLTKDTRVKRKHKADPKAANAINNSDGEELPQNRVRENEKLLENMLNDIQKRSRY